MDKWAVALDIARQIREKKKEIGLSFLWIAEQAKNLRDSEVWKSACNTFAEFSADKEIGLGMAPSSVRSLIDIYDTFVFSKLLTLDEAGAVGWHRLNSGKAVIKKIPKGDMESVKEILLSPGKSADTQDALRNLLPEHERNGHDECKKLLKIANKLWEQCNKITSEDMDGEFKKEISELLDKVRGYLLR